MFSYLPLPTIRCLFCSFSVFVSSSSQATKEAHTPLLKFTLQGTNTYLIGQGPSRILIDTAEGKPEWRTSLSHVLTSEKAAISTTLLTHWHPDHVGGVSDLLSLCPSSKIHKHSPNTSQLPITHDQKFQTEGATLRAFHCPGHTTDHMAFVLEEEDAMFTADNVLGQGTAVFEDLAAYMASLEAMRGAFGCRAYPGHGPVIDDGPGKVAEYISHRREREGEIVAVLKGAKGEGGGGCDAEGWTAMEVVKVVYKAYPEHLHGPAEGSVLHVLRKLEKEGKVSCQAGSERWRLESKAAL